MNLPPEILTVFGQFVLVIAVGTIVMLVAAFAGHFAGGLLERYL